MLSGAMARGKNTTTATTAVAAKSDSVRANASAPEASFGSSVLMLSERRFDGSGKKDGKSQAHYPIEVSHDGFLWVLGTSLGHSPQKSRV